MFKRSLAALLPFVLVSGCLPNGGSLPEPISGIWEEIEANLPGGLPFDLSELDPDALFELINNGGGSIDLEGLSGAIPTAITDELAAILEELGASAGDLGDLLGAGDLQALIDELLALAEPWLSFIEPFLQLLGFDSLEDALNDLLDLESLLASFGGDLQALLDELLGLAGSLPDATSCTLEDNLLTCETVEQVIDLSPLDAVLTFTVDVSGTFSSGTSATLNITVDLTCEGTDCDAILGQLDVDFPFTYTVEVAAP
jgi:hypothetical protein